MLGLLRSPWSTRASLYDNNFLFFGDWNVFLECLFVRETVADELDKQLRVEENHVCSSRHEKFRNAIKLSVSGHSPTKGKALEWHQ